VPVYRDSTVHQLSREPLHQPGGSDPQVARIVHGHLICSEHSAPATALSALDELVTASAAPFAALIARLVTILGIGQRTAEVIVAKAGGAGFSGARPGSKQRVSGNGLC
jgi:hypothetical protein